MADAPTLAEQRLALGAVMCPVNHDGTGGVFADGSRCYVCIAKSLLLVLDELLPALAGFEEFKSARTEANDGDNVWEFYDRKLWASLLGWKERALTAEAALARVGDTPQETQR